jgi:hypothetical protein
MAKIQPKVPDLSFDELNKARESIQESNIDPSLKREAQNTLAPIEHGKYAEQLFKDNEPLLGLSNIVTAPAWTGFKLANSGLRKLGFTENSFPRLNKWMDEVGGEKLAQEDWSDPSISEIGHAYTGMGKGFLGWLSRVVNNRR